MEIIGITEKAQQHMEALLAKQEGKYNYIRLGTRTKGCAGISYKIEFAEAPELGDEEITKGALNIVIDNKSLIYLIGLEIDFKQTALESGFVFNNPNKTGECGCGESFYV